MLHLIVPIVTRGKFLAKWKIYMVHTNRNSTHIVACDGEQTPHTLVHTAIYVPTIHMSNQLTTAGTELRTHPGG